LSSTHQNTKRVRLTALCAGVQVVEVRFPLPQVRGKAARPLPHDDGGNVARRRLIHHVGQVHLHALHPRRVRSLQKGGEIRRHPGR